MLVINIISRLPDDFAKLYEQFCKGKSVPLAVVAAVIILAIILAMTVFVVILNSAMRKIPVQYAKTPRKQDGGRSDDISAVEGQYSRRYPNYLCLLADAVSDCNFHLSGI